MAQTIIGIVSSDKRDKTITVSVASRETHPLYRKQYTKTRKYTAHDEKNEAGLGDRVEIEACRPFSKTKTYKLVRIVEKGKGKIELKEDLEGVAGQKVSPSLSELRRDRSGDDPVTTGVVDHVEAMPSESNAKEDN